MKLPITLDLILGPRKQIIIQFCLSFGPASVLRQGLHKGVMRPLPRLESEPKSGAIFGQLFISAALSPGLLKFGGGNDASYPFAESTCHNPSLLSPYLLELYSFMNEKKGV